MAKTVSPEFQAALDKFTAGMEGIYTAYMDKAFPNNPREVTAAQVNRKFVRMLRGRPSDVERGTGSVVGFVEIATGNVYYPAGWTGPAKGIRGNLYDAKGGLGMVGPYGVGTLR